MFDYTRRRGVEHTEIVLPTSAAKRDIKWARDRAALWNAAEQAEKRKDARVWREWEIALPAELDRKYRVQLAQTFAQDLANRYGCAVDIAIHRPHWKGGQRNHHAHLLATTQTIEAEGLGRKTDIELGDRDRGKKGLQGGADELRKMRERWAVLANDFLKEHGHEARIDHRSLKDQGIERQPTTHLGPAVSGLERKGRASRVGDRIRAERALEEERRRERQAELKSLEREEKGLHSEIILLSTDLKAALAARDAERAASRGAAHDQTRGTGPGIENGKILSPDEIQKAARENWLKYREQQAAKAAGKGAGSDRSTELDR